MSKKDNLKIQLRAVPYTSYSKVLQYRIDPDQDIIDDEEPESKFRGFLRRIGFNVNKKFDTGWKDIRVFSSPLTMELYDFFDDFNWGPIWCDNQDSLDYFKRMFKTYKDLKDYMVQVNTKGHERWEVARNAYLEKQKPLY